MPGSAPFRLNRSGLLLALISAGFAAEAGAAAGRVDFTVGEVTVTAADGRLRPVAKGADLDNGDTIRTNDGRIQVRFTDGSYVSLQPNTEFGIKDYRFEGRTDGSERGLFSLAKGAMRTVTGLIGRVNRSTYQIATPTATVGIRGTGGLIQILPDGSTLVNGTSGIWSLTNPAGSIDVPAGTSGLAPSDPKAPPQQTSDGPTVPPPPTTPPQQPRGTESGSCENTNDPACLFLGTPTGPSAPVLTTGSGFGIATAFFADVCQDNCIEGNVLAGSNANAVFNASGQLTSVTFTQPFSSTVNTLVLGSGGSHADFGTDGVIAWGRWIGPVSLTFDIGEGAATDNRTYGPNEGLHYVVGMPTPALPTTGSGTYALLGATRPTYLDGSTAPGTFSGSMNVTFSAMTFVNANFNIAMPDGKGFALTGTTCTSSSVFSMVPSVVGSGGACICGCQSYVQGFFSGANAERAGVGYHVRDLSASRELVGAAGFKKQ